MSKSVTKINSVHLTVQFIKHKDGIIAYAPSLDLSTVGKTLAKSQRMITEAVSIFFDDLVKCGKLTEVLSGLGWIQRRSTWNPPPMIKEKSISLKLPTLVTV
ncbi:MAG: hypothetical protein A3C79_00040 [Candidatus Taylorbacteria bacterium RIFCSPHIGHO2_02_FULL_45_28]|uniref:HicB-like antitoxin of toxin-antitoxin system domain-containing protein n=1 Tax=Candidatus Taylorbacteria bacterium RIFCSPHIGHO2_12_FULL_45_16 TaxID=1802315 RepID=A0A1G2N197_9BACT|nr:MAG: hypothetical protein A2830_01300 [Candidatus Taylorbacteria bacterium RIFCSPHIGHO2_01_FULL_44_110]OHA25424.1 MAG: hypothetical protein A3C79_00040 [Candidatus Taylorbacteria bacterium RIFCSPHIGHO2_02_FULL_45_28]OHA29092.1 MAG: hypothetical protein A3F51_00510 [Candidatus Taylorbacteria bacterium RIFCSPHIGHO2_12_FULL_45_16]OHA33314.1 MAG: hypothetical protein A3A23_01390 [Candidatus Taylorbacteria bacterium RIFCSPLOWO2_01_FULL_45_59]OHA38934.1 MAG: hypothetical protein A3I98_02630 [Candi